MITLAPAREGRQYGFHGSTPVLGWVVVLESPEWLQQIHEPSFQIFHPRPKRGEGVCAFAEYALFECRVVTDQRPPLPDRFTQLGNETRTGVDGSVRQV